MTLIRLDRQAAGLCCFALRQGNGQHPVLKLCFDGVGLHVAREREQPAELAVTPLLPVPGASLDDRQFPLRGC